jgi:hypothetical protein
MKYLRFSLTGPDGLLIIFYGFALLIGIDPWHLARHFALCIPIVAYVICTHCLLSLTMTVGAAVGQREVNGQGRRYVWHGVPVVLCLLLAAAGSCVMLFVSHMQRWLGGAV